MRTTDRGATSDDSHADTEPPAPLSGPQLLRVLYVEPDRLDARILALLAAESTHFRYGFKHVDGLRAARVALSRERFDLIIASCESDMAQTFLQGALLIGVPPMLLMTRDPSGEGVAAGAPILAKAQLDAARLDAVVENLLSRAAAPPS